MQKKQLFRHLMKKFLLQYRGSYFWGLLAVVVINALETLIPLGLKNITDSLGGKTDLVFDLKTYAAMILGAYVLIGLLRYAWRYFIIVTSRHIEVDVKRMLFDRLLKGKFSDVSKIKVGTAVSMLSQDAGDFRMFMGPGILLIIDMIAYLVYVPVLLFMVMGGPSWLIMIPFGLVPPVMHYYEKNIEKLLKNCISE